MRTKLSIFCGKIIEAGWLVAVVAVPLFFNIYTARTFEPDKITLLRIIAMVMVLAWVVKVVEHGRVGDGSLPFKAQAQAWLKTPLFLPTLGIVSVYLISTIFSISPAVSFWGSYQRLQGAYTMLSYITIFALLASNLRAREQVDRLITIIIAASVPVSLYGIIQHFGLDPLPWAGDVTSRVASNMGNAIFVASYLTMLIPVTISRLIESMTVIVKEEKASWGHTVLAAVYIFALAIQIITVIFSQSRGPMLGVLGSTFVMGILVLLLLRQSAADQSRLSVKEVLFGLVFVLPLGLVTGIGGGIGFFIGLGLEKVISFENIFLLGAVLGGLLGFLGLYVFMAAAGKGWRWVWLSWLGVAALAIGFMILLNIKNPATDPYTDPIRNLPQISRLASVMQAEDGSGKVRTLIWDAAMELIAPHEPLGITDDPLVKPDSFNIIRPLVGYGPESMFNAFAYVYPPGLAHVENRGSSADRSHNETIDSLVITGGLGFLAFYFLMISVFYYGLGWLGLVPTNAAKVRLVALLVVFGAIGAITPYLLQGRFTFMPVGLPFGVIAGLVLYLISQGVVAQKTGDAASKLSTYNVLLIGLLSAIIGHFIEVHFVFSIAVTYTYLWAYLGLMVALSKIDQLEQTPTVEPAESQPAATATESPDDPANSDEPVEEFAARSRKTRSRRAAAVRRKSPSVSAPASSGLWLLRPESWETWLGSQGLAMAIILIILAFDFITPQFSLSLTDKSSGSFIWLVIITWCIGAAISFSTLAVRRTEWPGQLSWPRAVLLYSITSLSYFFFYAIAHSINFSRRITVTSLDDVIQAANVLVNGLIVFYIFVFILMVIIAVTLCWRQVRGLAMWRAENWWLYPPLVLFIAAAIWFKNVDVVRADIYLKEGERYRGNRQWTEVVALHELGRSIDSDEDFYYLMLALDYQLMAQDGNLKPEDRQRAWLQGEQIALDARQINPYNPDNTGNMGRYYFTLGQVFDPAKFKNALDFFHKATVLAPSNVIYHNLWAQTNYIVKDYASAVDRLQTSISIDGKYPPTWILLGDTYAAMGDVEKALTAHTQGIMGESGGDGWSTFADQFLNQRLNFYASAGRGSDIIAVMQQVLANRPDATDIIRAIGQVYALMGQRDKAVTYFEQAHTLGDNSDQTLRSLANTYLAAKQFDQAETNYRLILEQNANDVEANSALAYIYAQQGRIDDAILHNKKVLEQRANDYDSLKNLAILLQQKQQWDEALKYAQQAQQAAPEAEKPSWAQFIQNLQNQPGVKK